MSGLIMAAQLIAGLSLLVFVHELGHFLAAKMFGMRVDKFYIFFDFGDKKLWSKKIGETEYGIGWMPLGGYVKIAGMIDESMDKEQMKQDPEPWEFRSKPAWQRFIVMIGGIVMNLLTGLIIFAFYLGHYEKEYTNPESTEIYAFELGQEQGFQTGDKIIEVNGKKIKRFKDAKSMGTLFGADFVIERNGKKMNLSVPEVFHHQKPMFDANVDYVIGVESVPDSSYAYAAGLRAGDKFVSINGKPVKNFYDLQSTLKKWDESQSSAKVPFVVKRKGSNVALNSDVYKGGRMGFMLDSDPEVLTELDKTAYSFPELFSYGAKEGWEMIYYNAIGIGKMFTGKLPVVENLQSPIGIARNFYGGEWIGRRFWYITGLLSFILAFMNILPIPALDGGHMVFLTIEMITGKPVSERVLMIAQTVGMFILIPLMVFILGKDAWVAVQDWFTK